MRASIAVCKNEEQRDREVEIEGAISFLSRLG